ncbi:hypothetical protein [Sulfitobacter sp. S190]|nr:hypothetical protein [Sulfitobacter sp. S190]UWR22785.1 hypothetical protein K3756_01940 [Sulfitobacter sp. S190]
MTMLNYLQAGVLGAMSALFVYDLGFDRGAHGAPVPPATSAVHTVV